MDTIAINYKLCVLTRGNQYGTKNVAQLAESGLLQLL